MHASISSSGLSSFGLSFELFSVVAIVLAVCAAIACGRWARAERMRAFAEKNRSRERLRKLQRDLQLRNALIHALPESVIVLTNQKDELLSFQGASRVLKECLAGPDSNSLAIAIDRLLMEGKKFLLRVRTGNQRSLVVQGRPLGDRAIVCLRSDEPTMTMADDVRTEPGFLPLVEEGRAVWSSGKRSLLEASRHDGVVVIGLDGRVKKFNKTFAEYMSIPESALRKEPHLDYLASLATGKEGQENIWATVSAAVCSAEPERYSAWGAETVAAGRRLWLSFERLSNGATLVIFREDTRSRVFLAA